MEWSATVVNAFRRMNLQHGSRRFAVRRRNSRFETSLWVIAATVIVPGLWECASATACIDYGEFVRPQWQYRTGGFPAVAAAGAGEFMYVADAGGRIDVFAISPLSRPELIANVRPGGGEATLKMQGSYLYALDSELFAYDVTAPDSPVEVGRWRDDRYQPLGEFTFSGHYAYIPAWGGFSETEGMLVLDISEPTDIRAVDVFDGLGTGGLISATGTRLFAVGKHRVLQTIDISDPASVALLSETPLELNPTAMVAEGGFIYVAFLDTRPLDSRDWRAGVEVFDARNPAGQLVRAGSTLTYAQCRRMVISDQTLFMMDINGVTAVDVSDSQNPQVLFRHRSSATSLTGGYVANGLLAVAGYSNLEVINLANFRMIETTTDIQPRFYQNQIQEFAGYALANDFGSVRMLEYLDAKTMRTVSELDLPDYLWKPPLVFGRMAYVLHSLGRSVVESGVLQVVDLSDPSDLRLMGSVDLSGQVGPMAISASFLYVSAGTEGIHVINVADPMNPQRIGSVDYPGESFRVFASERLLLVCGDGGNWVYDIAEPSSPVFLYALEFGGVDLVRGDYAYLDKRRPNDLELAAIHLPTGTLVSSTPMPFTTSDAAWTTHDDILYITQHRSVMVISLRDPANPVLLGSGQLPPDFEFAGRVSVVGDDVWVLADDGWSVMPRQCDFASVPIAIDGLSASMEASSVVIKWSMIADPQLPPLRLMGRKGNASWEVPLEASAGPTQTTSDRSHHVLAGGTVTYAVEVHLATSGWQSIAEITVDLGPGTRRAAIVSTAPNPFNPSTEIVFDAPVAALTTIQIYDLKGRLVSTLLDEPANGGQQTITWRPKNLPSGIYFLRIESGGMIDTHRVALLK
jgi:hypothetical protein